MEMEKNSTLKYGIWLTGASMMFVSAWFCVRLTGTVGEMGRYLDSMDSVVCMEELLDYEKEENGQALEENDLAEPTLQVRMLEREDSAAAVSDSTQLSISGADYQVLYQHSNGVYQFSPVKNGTIDTVSISEETKQAVELALDGMDLSKGALYFAARNAANEKNMRWFDTHLVRLFAHGGHEFFG